MKQLTILHLYPNEMSLYGDAGNVRVLQKRLEWRGYAVDIKYHHVGSRFDYTPDLVVGGGGQDSGQVDVARDLEGGTSFLRSLAEDNVPMLMICGMYQLFGHQMATASGSVLNGVSIFNATTIATPKRMVGDITARTKFGLLQGFENHSGETFLHGDQAPLGHVVEGYGNTTKGQEEGAVINNVFGTYLHGCVLARNAFFADLLLAKALERKGIQDTLTALPDPLLA